MNHEKENDTKKTHKKNKNIHRVEEKTILKENLSTVYDNTKDKNSNDDVTKKDNKSAENEISRINDDESKIDQLHIHNPTNYSDIVLKSSRKLSEDNKSTNVYSSRLRDDSIFMEARDNMETPTDGETGRAGISNFFSYENENDHGGNKEDGDLKEHMVKIGNTAISHKLRGNTLFKKGKFKDAISEYTKALDELKMDSKYYELVNLSNITLIRMECLNNIAMCYLILKDYEKVLRWNSNNFHALSYKAKSLISLNRLKEAVEIIKKALSIKYSRSLMNNLKEIEDKLNEMSSTKSNPGEINEEDEYKKGNKNKNKKEITSIESKKDNESESFFNNTLFKFIKIITISSYEFLKRHKILLALIILLWIIAFRKRFKAKLSTLLQFIKF